MIPKNEATDAAKATLARFKACRKHLRGHGLSIADMDLIEAALKPENAGVPDWLRVIWRMMLEGVFTPGFSDLAKPHHMAIWYDISQFIKEEREQWIAAGSPDIFSAAPPVAAMPKGEDTDRQEALRLFRILKSRAKMEDLHHLDGTVTQEPFIHISAPLESLDFIERALLTHTSALVQAEKDGE